MSEVLRLLDAGEASESDRPTLPIDVPRSERRRSRMRALVVASVAASLAVFGVTLFALRPAETPATPSVFADDVVRVVVAESDPAHDDPLSRVVATGVTEALRARLAAVDGVVVIDAPPGRVPPGVEHAWSLRVMRLGEKLRLVASVTRHPGAERWLTVERSEPADGGWERIDAIADALVGRYRARLAEER
jgi:hypothetical protein